jgi:glycerol-1-phosphate dehydrogenase [NAD(P)+]
VSNELRAELEAAGRIAAEHGRTGRIGLSRILIGGDSLDHLPAAVARVTGSGEIVILEDATPMLIDGQDLKSRTAAMLARVGTARRVVLGPTDGGLHADSGAIAAAAEAAEGAGCLVSVGSGTLTDIAKEASHRSGVPLVAVQTAASVNGYADGMAVVLKDGVKRTVPSAWPTELLVDTRVLVAAPQTLTRSGFAEMMAMFTAPADWRLAAAVGLDPRYDPDVIELFRSRGDELLAAAAAVGAGDPDALELLAVLLTQSGLAMGAVARTAPLSGTEHLISHLLDMAAVAGGGSAGLHGAQVGVAAVIAACVWERILDRIDPADIDTPPPSSEVAEELVEKAFAGIDPGGAMARECWGDYQRKLAAWNEVDRYALVSEWASLRHELAAMVRSPELIVAALIEAGAATRFSLLTPPVDGELARWAVASCHLMRDRFSVVDLAFLSGNWTADDVDSVLERADGLGAGL